MVFRVHSARKRLGGFEEAPMLMFCDRLDLPVDSPPTAPPPPSPTASARKTVRAVQQDKRSRRLEIDQELHLGSKTK